MPEQREIKAFGLASILTDEAGHKAISEGETGTRITMIASTEAVDRDGEVIRVSAWTWNKETLPKLLWGHNYYEASAVIGKITRVYRKDGKLLIDAELADKVPEAHTARLVAGLMRDGFLDQGSVGFLPIAWTDPDGKDYTRDNPGSWWGSVPGREYTKVELLEFSIVPVPSQRESLAVAVRALGLADASVREAPAPTVPAVAGDSTTPDSAQAPADAPKAPEPPCECSHPTLLQRLFTGQGSAGAIPSRAEMDGETSADGLLARLRAGDVTRSAERAEEVHQ
jgi:hypothetical protein